MKTLSLLIFLSLSTAHAAKLQDFTGKWHEVKCTTEDTERDWLSDSELRYVSSLSDVNGGYVEFSIPETEPTTLTTGKLEFPYENLSGSIKAVDEGRQVDKGSYCPGNWGICSNTKTITTAEISGNTLDYKVTYSSTHMWPFVNSETYRQSLTLNRAKTELTMKSTRKWNGARYIAICILKKLPVE